MRAGPRSGARGSRLSDPIGPSLLVRERRLGWPRRGGASGLGRTCSVRPGVSAGLRVQKWECAGLTLARLETCPGLGGHLVCPPNPQHSGGLGASLCLCPGLYLLRQLSASPLEPDDWWGERGTGPGEASVGAAHSLLQEFPAACTAASRGGRQDGLSRTGARAAASLSATG